ncbi:MAG: hypothetical protein AAF813_01715 [Pseudomonadota bacterium]
MHTNIAIVAQNGRLAYEALLFAASYRRFNWQNKDMRLHVCTPINNDLWPENPDIRGTEVATKMEELGATIVPFENATFGAEYPHSNKIYALEVLPKGENFVFFDTDTMIKGDISKVDVDFDVPTGGYEVPVWPVLKHSEHTRAQIWGALYDRFDLPTDGWWRPADDPDDAARFPYFNGGCYYYRCPRVFANAFRHIAHSIHRDPPAELEGQRLFPFLDQVSLALTLAFLGGEAREKTDGNLFEAVSFHYFSKPRLFVQAKRTGHLHLARGFVRREGFRQLFEQDEGFNYYFLGEGHEVVLNLMKEKRYTLMNFSELRDALREKDAWYK